MADARPFHWESNPRKSTGRSSESRGGRRLEGSRLDQRRQETPAQLMAAATLTGERCRFTTCRESRTCGFWPKSTGHRRDRRSSGTQRLRSCPGGDRRVAVRPSSGGQDAGQLHPARPAAGHVSGAVIISNPAGPDAARRPVKPARRRDAALGAEIEYRNRLLLLRETPAGCAVAV